MGRLTTHVLDTANGCPGHGIKVELFRVVSAREKVKEDVTNDDGRCDTPLLDDDSISAGDYELVFHVGDYFAAAGHELTSPRFLDQIVIRFGISSIDEHYHVPLLVSPYSYSTYRGS